SLGLLLLPVLSAGQPAAALLRRGGVGIQPGLRADARSSGRDAGVQQLLQRGGDRRERLAGRLGPRRTRGILRLLRVGGFGHAANMGRRGQRGKGTLLTACCQQLHRSAGAGFVRWRISFSKKPMSAPDQVPGMLFLPDMRYAPRNKSEVVEEM